MREQELADRRIEREAVHALPGRVHEHRAGAVDHVARGDLSPARLQHVLHLAVPAARDLLHDGEDRAHRHVDVDVRRAVERIEEEAVLAALEAVGDRDDPGLLLRRHGAQPAAVVHRLDDRVVGEDVELLLDLALHVRRARWRRGCRRGRRGAPCSRSSSRRAPGRRGCPTARRSPPGAGAPAR